MDLALFIPGAYIWPVYRNFESFIAALGVPSAGVRVLEASPCYPAQERTDSTLRGLADCVDRRLVRLHRELYDALLRPAEMYARDNRDIAACFWPDLCGTNIDALMSAFLYGFIHREARETPVMTGLNTLRAVFFNHDASSPELWLHTARARLRGERREISLRQLSFTAPTRAKLHNLDFVINSERDRPTEGAGWLTGSARRQLDGTCLVTVSHGLDPSIDLSNMPESVGSEFEREARAAVGCVFGWQEVAV